MFAKDKVNAIVKIERIFGPDTVAIEPQSPAIIEKELPANKSIAYLQKNFLQASNTLNSGHMQALILHTSREEILDPLTNNYPLALLPVVNKPLVCYQLEYLLAHGIREIMISCERKYASKIERYLKNFFKPSV